MLPSVFLGLGSNEGDRARTLDRAVDLLGQRGFVPETRSSFYLTEPVGGPPQDWYLNAVVGGRSRLEALGLLEACRSIESQFGRVRTVPFGPRTLDIDLLFYGDAIEDGPVLQLPHPRLHERRFVLVPLDEIAPRFRHPVLGLTVRELLAACPDRSAVLPYVTAEGGACAR